MKYVTLLFLLFNIAQCYTDADFQFKDGKLLFEGQPVKFINMVNPGINTYPYKVATFKSIHFQNNLLIMDSDEGQEQVNFNLVKRLTVDKRNEVISLYF